MTQPSTSPEWLEITFHRVGDEIHVGADSSRDDVIPARSVGIHLDALVRFASSVQKAAEHGKALSQATLDDARTFHQAVINSEVVPIIARQHEASGEPVLVRLMVHDPELQAIPWEALCNPGETLGFLGTSPMLLPVRGVAKGDPWQPREIRGAVSVLAIAPTGRTGLANLEQALAAQIESKNVTWLDPIINDAARLRHLPSQLCARKTAHVVHFLGHGGIDEQGRPTLRMADDEDGEEDWIPAEGFAKTLQSCLSEPPQLIVLETCDGAKPSTFASAAEILARSGASAVVAHQWPVRADAAREYSTEFYRVLTHSDRNGGDVAWAVNAARLAILNNRKSSAEAHSPVLYLRGTGSKVLDFARRGKTETANERKYLSWRTEGWKRQIRDVVGQGVHLPRKKPRERLAKAVENHRIIAILGESGVGKSALVKRFVNETPLPGPHYCADAITLASELISGGIDAAQKIDAELRQTSEEWTLFVLDSAERLVDPIKVEAVARALGALRINDDTSPWQLVITCQAAEWDRIRYELNFPNALTMSVNTLEPGELAEIAKEIGYLEPLVRRKDLAPIISRFKVLDIVSQAAKEIGLPDIDGWIGESNLVTWFWEKYVCALGRDCRHGHLLKEIATKMADNWHFAVPTSDLTPAHLELVDALVRPGLLLRQDETLRFPHDVYADYARQRYLIGEITVSRFELLKGCSSNPLWHRAVRLLGQHLLEKNHLAPDSVGEWRRALKALHAKQTPQRTSGRQSRGRNESDSVPGVAVDLLLEAIAYAANPRALLDLVHGDLIANGGILLRRFLRRFAETPKRNFSEIRPQWNHPMPDYLLWHDPIDWIVKHQDNVLELAPNEFLDIAKVWIVADFYWRALPHFDDAVTTNAPEVTEMLVYLAEHHRHQVHKQELLYLLILRCGPDLRDSVVPLLRDLAGRIPKAEPKRPAREIPDNLSEEERRLLEPIPFLRRPVTPRAPWPDGPLATSDAAFRKVALSEVGASLLIALGCEFAREIFLSVLIELPKPLDVHNYCSTMDQLGLAEAPWTESPPFYDFPPTWRLLENDPAIGIDIIVRLVDFVTERWIEGWKINNTRGRLLAMAERDDPLERNSDGPRICLTVNNKVRHYFGDRRVFEWSVGHANTPCWASAALMSLERWLYDRDEDGTLDPKVLASLLERSNSAAVVGVLFDLALKRPSLLKGPLEPLVGCLDLHRWEDERFRSGKSDRDAAMIAWQGKGKTSWERAKEWHELPHRFNNFLNLILDIFHEKDFDWPYLEYARQEWIGLQNRINGHPDSNAIAYLVAYCDRENVKRVDSAGDVSVEFYPPADVQALARKELEDKKRLQPVVERATFIDYCRKILDGKTEVSSATLNSMLEYAARNGTPSKVSRGDTDEWLLGDAVSARCAIAAVAIVKMPSWLEQNPRRKKQCTEWLLSACAAHADFSMGEHRFVYKHRSWDLFCMRALVPLWSSAPHDSKVRAAIGTLVGASYDDIQHHTVGDVNHNERSRMFVELASIRAKLGDEFGRLLHLAILFARLRRISRAGPPETSPNVDGAFRKLVKKFARGDLAPLPHDWPRLAGEWPEGLRPSKKWPAWVQAEGEDYGFDLAALVCALCWLPIEVGNIKATDRAFVVETVMRLNEVILGDLGEDRRDDVPMFNRAARVQAKPVPTESSQPDPWLERTWKAVKNVTQSVQTPQSCKPKKMRQLPHLLEYKIAQWCAAYVVREANPATRQHLWGPWMQLHATRHHWVEIFVGQLCFEGLSETPATSKFLDAFKEIYDHALGEGGWLDGDGAGYGGIKVASAFLRPFGSKFSDVWTSDRADIAIALSVYWEKWAISAMRHPWCVGDFLWLLQTPAFSALRRQALTWVVRTDVAEWIEEERTQDALVYLLQQIEEERIAGTSLTQAERAAFLTLLDHLVRLQNRHGMVLAAQLRPVM